MHPHWSVPDGRALREVLLGKGTISLLHGHILYLSQNHALAHQPLEGLLVTHHANIIQHLYTGVAVELPDQQPCSLLCTAQMLQQLLSMGMHCTAALLGRMQA